MIRHVIVTTSKFHFDRYGMQFAQPHEVEKTALQLDDLVIIQKVGED